MTKPTTKRDHLRLLARYCRQHGGRLESLSQRAFDLLFDRNSDSDAAQHGYEDLSASPFTYNHGMWWRRKIIYTVRGREEIGSIIHEMGHVFASPHPPHHDCSQCHEWNWFGWEVALARRIGAGRVWSRDNADYDTGDGGGGTWKKLSAAQRRAVVAERIAHARKIGVVDADGAPRNVR